MKLPLSTLPPEYRDWVDGLEPAWTSLDPAVTDSLLAEPNPDNGAIRLSDDCSDAQLAGSTFVSNALVLLRAVAQGDGLKLTARGKPAPGCALHPTGAPHSADTAARFRRP